MDIKRKILSSFICLTLLFFSIFSSTGIFSIRSNAKDNTNYYAKQNDDLDMSCCAVNGQPYVSLESPNVHFLSRENIVATFLVHSEDVITNISYTQNGFTVLLVAEDSNDPHRVNVLLSCEETSASHSLSVQIDLSSDISVNANLFAVKNECGVFISPFSEDDALQRYFDFAIETNLMTRSEYRKIKAELSRRYVVKNEFEPRLIQSNEGISTLSNSGVNTYISGTFHWGDDNGVNHPLRRVMVRIYDEEINDPMLLGTVYTDDNGYFSFGFDNADSFWDFENGGYDIFFRIYAGDDISMVEIGDTGEEYYYESEVYDNMATGDSKGQSLSFLSFDGLGQAFQISQAIITASDYASEMTGRTPDDVVVYYPYSSGCSYHDENQVIRITGNSRKNSTVPHSYASWDVIMHEYGHHMQYQLGIIDSPKGDHKFGDNLAEKRNSKNDGIRLAWAEAWPTIFGMEAQDYYSSYLQNISAINDSTYDAYNFENPYDIENNSDFKGEACEGSVVAVLWDLFDSVDELEDQISLGHTAYWAVTTGNQSKTFSSFIQYFYSIYPDYVDEIGKSLSWYGMAAFLPDLVNFAYVSASVPPIFEWEPHGESEDFSNNSFSLIFYDEMDREICRTATTTESTYTLTQSEWDTVLYADGDTYTVAVISMQTTAPVTGPYISHRSDVYTKPDTSVIVQSIPAIDIFGEGIVNLKPGQRVEYDIVFNKSGQKIIQTTSRKNTDLEIYVLDGGMYDEDTEHSGYSGNSYISLYMNAGVHYKVVVKFSSEEETGEVRLALSSISGIYTDLPIGTFPYVSDYEDHHTLPSQESVDYFTEVDANNANAILFIPPTEGSYCFSVECEYAVAIHIIDPKVSDGMVFNDDYAYFYPDDNFTLTRHMSRGVRHMILISLLDAPNITENVEVTLNIEKVMT